MDCLSGIAQDRENAKLNDIAKSAMYLFVGLDLVVAVKNSKLSRLLS